MLQSINGVTTPVPGRDIYNRLPESSRMRCMEVWGGKGDAHKKFNLPGLDIWLFSSSSPASQMIGGDCHFISSCASGRITRMLIADVCGQEQVASHLTASMRELLAKNINRIQQKRVVCELNRQLREYANLGGFVSAMLGTYFAPTRTLSLCNVGHPSPIVHRASTGQWLALNHPTAWIADRRDAPLGVLDEEEYQHFSMTLDLGDMGFCCSPVLAECRDENGKTLGVDGLLRQLRRLNIDEPAELISSWLAGLSERNSEVLKDHDITVLLFQVTNRSVRWQDNLLAPFRVFGGVRDMTTIR